MASLLSAARGASRACRRARGISRSNKKELRISSCQTDLDIVQRLIPEPDSDTDEEPTSTSSTYSGGSCFSFASPSIPGSVDGSDSECENEAVSSSETTSSKSVLPSFPQHVPTVREKNPQGHSGMLDWSDRETFRIAQRLCGKAKFSRKTLCAAFNEADQKSSGYLSKNELAKVFHNFNMPEADAAKFFSMMGGDGRGLFWREAMAIIAPLFQPEA